MTSTSSNAKLIVNKKNARQLPAQNKLNYTFNIFKEILDLLNLKSTAHSNQEKFDKRHDVSSNK